MKMALGLAGMLAACALAAAPADNGIVFDSSKFEVLPIGQGKGEKLSFADGTLSIKAQNGSPFICGTARHPVTPGGIARASVKAKGKGKAGIMIYSFGPDGKCVGWQTTGVRDLKEDAPVTLSSEVRISPHYTGGREIKSIAWGIYALRGCEGVFSDYQAAYEEKTPNSTLKPAKSERGGIIVRTRKLTEQAKALAKQGKRPGVMFLGDSITQGWELDPNGKLPGGLAVWNRDFAPLGAVNFGISGERVEHVLYRITECNQLVCRPEIVVLMIGTNNLNMTPPPDTPENIAAGIDNLLAVIRQKVPDAKIILSAVTPRGGPFPTDAINRHLPDIAKKHGAVYLDPIKVMTDGTGNAKDRTVFRDGLHFSPKGYERYASVLLPEILKLKQSSGK